MCIFAIEYVYKISFCKYNEILLALHFIHGRQNEYNAGYCETFSCRFSFVKLQTYLHSEFFTQYQKPWEIQSCWFFRYISIYIFLPCHCNCPFFDIESMLQIEQEKWQQTNKYWIQFAPHTSAEMLNSIKIFLFAPDNASVSTNVHIPRIFRPNGWKKICVLSDWEKQITIFFSFRFAF